MECEKTIQLLETKNTKLYKKFNTIKRANNRLKNENKELKKIIEHLEKSEISQEWIDLN
jgi:hypothetical protein